MIMILYWFNIQFTFRGNPAKGAVDGVTEEFRRQFKDSEILKANDDRTLLEKCYPPSDHFSEEGYNKMLKAIKENDFKTARDALQVYALETAAPWCVDVFKKVVTEYCTQCPMLLKDALPMTYY